MKLDSTPPSEWQQCFVQLTEELLKEFPEKRPLFFSNPPPFRPEEGIFFPKPSVLTLVLASQINLLWIPYFAEWQWGEGRPE